MSEDEMDYMERGRNRGAGNGRNLTSGSTGGM